MAETWHAHPPTDATPGGAARPGVLAITCMKDEGAILPEWIAYHQSIGFDHFLIFTNDCSDGTDAMVARLAELGIATHRDNTRHPGQRASYQIRAYRRALREPVYRAHGWAMVLDADEYLNIHAGDGSVHDLIAGAGHPDAISITWRLFGDSGIDRYDPGFLTERFTRAAPLHCPRPAQAWGFKTLLRSAAFARLGTHRPLAPAGGDWTGLRWVNGSGQPMPARYRELTRGNWRSAQDSLGYGLAQLNHYAVRARQSFLVKSLKGAAHGGIARSLDYWMRMNRNEQPDLTIAPRLAAMRDRHAALMADARLAALHARAVGWHRACIAAALAQPDSAALYRGMQDG
ncbi:glycosyltransferase family 2 protein [Rhodovulum strictum]|nr:glycosyltransferase family 2 protein [Rhodovulum strictum]